MGAWTFKSRVVLIATALAVVGLAVLGQRGSRRAVVPLIGCGVCME